MRADTADVYASSHAGQHGDFKVFWDHHDPFGSVRGWYWQSNSSSPVGPFATSQAAFGDYKDKVDAELAAKPKGVYGEWCRNPAACAGKGYCPLDPICAD